MSSDTEVDSKAEAVPLPGGGGSGIMAPAALSGTYGADEDFDRRFLPPQSAAVEPLLASTVQRLLRRRIYDGDSYATIGAELSAEACVRGRVSAATCAEVLAYHCRGLSDLRFRAEEVSADLDRACKAADRRRMKEAFVADMIHGPTFDRGGCGGGGGGGGSLDSGLGAFRHVLEDEVKKPKGGYDAILHSMLSGNAQSP
jgi:hypothetical protein